MIGSIVLRDSELVGIAGESDDLRTTSEQLGVLNGIPAESTDTQNPDHPTRAERASIAKFFHATEGCLPRPNQLRSGARAHPSLVPARTLHHGGAACRPRKIARFQPALRARSRVT